MVEITGFDRFRRDEISFDDLSPRRIIARDRMTRDDHFFFLSFFFNVKVDACGTDSVVYSASRSAETSAQWQCNQSKTGCLSPLQRNL